MRKGRGEEAIWGEHGRGEEKRRGMEVEAVLFGFVSVDEATQVGTTARKVSVTVGTMKNY